LNCQDFADDILLHAAGALEPEEIEPLLDHLASGCPRCAGRLTEAKSLLGLLVLTLPPATPSEETRRELLNRLATPTKRLTMPPPAPIKAAPVQQPQMRVVGSASPSWWTILAIPSAIAASIAAIITIFFAMRMTQSLGSQNSEVATNFQRSIGLFTTLVEQQQQQINSLKSAANGTSTVEWAADPHLKTFVLAGTENQPSGARARIFYDRDKAMCVLYAQGMTPAPQGKTYELWYLPSDGKAPIAAGSFDPSPTGDATMVATVPPDVKSTLANGAVTDEPLGTKITAPSGSFQLKPKLGQ